MSNEIIAVIIGGIIGIIGSLSTTMLFTISSNQRRSKAIRAVAIGEITAIKEKAERYIHGQSTKEGLSASTPMLTTIAPELGFLSENEVIYLRRVITLDMEMRREETAEKTNLAIQACDEALHIFYHR